ncbi:MAG: hypothetical protein SFU86_20960 [Pirellulaceae bacterium]|nr:hypothetical protein [Pirellulaceae bacterium]
MRPIAMFVAVLAMLAAASHAEAAGPRRAQQQGHVQPQSYNRYQQQMYWRSWYPKYQAGFHSRHLDNIGVPSGDVGMHGSPYQFGYGSAW